MAKGPMTVTTAVHDAQQRALLAAIRDDMFTPDALRNHAEVLDAVSAGLAALAKATRDPEHRAVNEGLAEDCLRFAAVFRGLADRERTARLQLPGGVESQIVEWANPETCPGGRADDAMIHLETADKTYLGTLTLGWFREHTSVKDGEDSLRSSDDDETDAGDDE